MSIKTVASTVVKSKIFKRSIIVAGSLGGLIVTAGLLAKKDGPVDNVDDVDATLEDVNPSDN